ncbi:Hsp90 protein-domain-containing protein [Jimgerdemannia flammicorona]|uniref:Hsp90 protein-domain-containing protein n=2 Tax=Jimgerdemannia flammicorona TaxID=994334 RepID=A0A433Q347_9FUNG|nr:Hsp90 protein-domain-containing protein [Jimgerdemannia flammicorona]RUS24178.1 Hsp90 protein-domain-containing protein [Jimgerdemannia flammicorona]
MKGRYTLLFALLLLLSASFFVARSHATDESDQIVLQAGGPAIKVEQSEKFEFQTEVSRLMHLIINSLYKSREIFLRELISNASDALDKIRFLSLTDSAAYDTNPYLNVSIVADKATRTLTITDSGVGMSRKQLKENLGTIAKSGTSEFLSAIEKDKDKVSQIGQFGVGFYSVFLVADRVTVASKCNDDPVQHVWISEAVSDFTIAEDPRGNTLGRGTQITLHIKEDALEFLEEATLKELISKYSEFINFPIYLWATRTETVPVATEEDVVEKEVSEDEDEAAVVDDELEGEEKEKEPKTKTIEVSEFVQMNTVKPIWTRDPKDVSDTEYVEFYKALTRDTSDPLSWAYFKGEGEVEFRAIIYVPPKAPANYYQTLSDMQRTVRLFVKRVFITDELGTDFMPRWLSFIRALVDAEDLPLNVSRETLQKHKLLNFISKRLIKKAIDLFHQIAKTEPDKFTDFIREYGPALKMGAIDSQQHRKRLTQLLRFASSYNSSLASIGLDDYITRMKANQTSIFFITGSSVDEIEQSPFLERLLARGYEVIYMIEPIDEMLVQHVPGYNGKMFTNIAKGNLKFGDEKDLTVEEEKEQIEQFLPLTQWLTTVLSEYVEKVVLSKRLTTSPMAIVASEHGWTGHMERLMAAQAQRPDSQEAMMYNMFAHAKRILEINPSHPVVERLLQRVEDGEADDETKELVTVLYETTAIRSGYTLKDLTGFTRRVETVVRKRLGVDLKKEAEVKVEIAEEKTEEERKKDEETKIKADQMVEGMSRDEL